MNEHSEHKEHSEHHEHKEHSEHHEHKEHEVAHEHQHLEQKKKKLSALDIWRLTSAILVILLIISIFTGRFGLKSSKQGVLTKEKAANKAIDYINNNLMQPGVTIKLNGVEEKNDLYAIKINVAGREYESYVTKDGALLFPSVVDMAKEIPKPTTPDTTPTNVPKEDKPKVELFVMSYCPYGTQAEKGMLPVVSLLGAKIDFNVRFVYYAMHGEKEIKEQTLQYCIQSEQKDKFTSYLSCFLKEGKSEECLTEAKMEKEKFDSCIDATDKKFKITEKFNDKSTWLNGKFPLFGVDSELNEKYGVGGSPTLVVNGVEASSNRDPASYLKVICSAFNQEPQECQKELSSTAPPTGFGYEGSGSGAEGSCS